MAGAVSRLRVRRLRRLPEQRHRVPIQRCAIDKATRIATPGANAAIISDRPQRHRLRAAQAERLRWNHQFIDGADAMGALPREERAAAAGAAADARAPHADRLDSPPQGVRQVRAAVRGRLVGGAVPLSLWSDPPRARVAVRRSPRDQG